MTRFYRVAASRRFPPLRPEPQAAERQGCRRRGGHKTYSSRRRYCNSFAIALTSSGPWFESGDGPMHDDCPVEALTLDSLRLAERFVVWALREWRLRRGAGEARPQALCRGFHHAGIGDG